MSSETSSPHRPMQVFILGTGRSGTHAMSQMLSQLDGCYVPHEIEPLLLSEVVRYLRGELKKEDIVALLRSTRSPAVVGGALLSGESNQRLSFILPCLREAFPDARYLWMIRDGREVVASTMQRGWYTNAYDRMDSRRAAWERYRVRADDVGELSSSEWEAMSVLEKNCWYWSYTNRLIERDTKQLGLNVLQLRLPTVQKHMKEVMSFLGLPSLAPSAFMRTNAENNVRLWYPGRPIHWRYWSGSHRRAFEDVAGQAMDQFFGGWREGWHRTVGSGLVAILWRACRLTYCNLYDALSWITRPARRMVGLTNLHR